MVIGLIGTSGLLCTLLLVIMAARSSRAWGDDARSAARYPVSDIFPIMAEHFPETYERYRKGRLPRAELDETWVACCAIYDARAEIEELCS